MKLRRAVISVPLDTLTGLLKLPKGVSIRDLQWDYETRARGVVRFLLVDNGDTIPEHPEGEKAPDVGLIYVKRDGETVFDRFASNCEACSVGELVP